MKYLFFLFYFPFILFAQDGERIHRSEYFANAPFYESPIHPFMFQYQLTQEEATKRVHIQVDYDVYGRVIQLSLKVGEFLKDLDGAFFGMNIHAPVTKIRYTTTKEFHSFHDRFGNRIKVLGNVYSKEYQKDAHGRNVSLLYKDQDGKLCNSSMGASTFKWSHESDGSIIELRTNTLGSIVPLRGAFQFMRTRMIYGPWGYFAMLQNIDEEGNLVASESGAAVYKYYFDHVGRFLRWEVFDEYMQPSLGPSNTGGELNIFQGAEFLGIDFFDVDHTSPAVHWSGAERFRMKYDQYGNVSETAYLSSLGNPMTNNSGYSLIKKIWSTDGRFLLSTETFGENGDPVENNRSGHSKTEFIRNNDGLILEERYLGLSGNIKGHKESGIAIKRYEYDHNNRLINQILLDDAGTPIEP